MKACPTGAGLFFDNDFMQARGKQENNPVVTHWVAGALLSLLFLASSATFGAIAVDTTTTGQTTGTSVTISHTTSGTSRFMLVGVSIGLAAAGQSVSTITYNGTSLNFEGAIDSPANEARIEIWSLVAPDTGTHDVVVNLSAGHQGATIGVMTFTGVHQTNPLGAFASNSGVSLSASTTVAVICSGCRTGMLPKPTNTGGGPASRKSRRSAGG
ncbi:MAG: hypothetical protein ACE5LB_12485, partial [Acidiferrobacterales bacterium]